MPGRSFMAHGTKDAQKLVGFAVQHPRFSGKFWLGSDYHAHEKLCLFGLFHAAADRVLKILLRDSLVGFAVVGPDTRAGAHQLIDQTVVGRVAWNLFGKSN